MKKFILFAAAVLAMASCGNKTNNAETEGVDSVVVEISEQTQAVSDSLTSALTEQLQTKDAKQLTTTVATLQTVYAKLIEDGKLEEAKVYASQVKAFVEEHAEEIKSLAEGNEKLAALVEGVKNLPIDAAVTAEQALAAVGADAKTIAETAKSAVENAAKEKVNEVANELKDKADEKVNEAKQKANDAATKAVNDAASKAIKALGGK